MKKQYQFVATAVVAFLLLGVHPILAAESVNINTASAVELDAIVGIGPALAQRIIELRPFDSLDDLLKVKGIGEKTLQKIKDQGLASVSGQAILLKEEPSQSKKELPNKEKSGTTVGVVAAAEQDSNTPITQESSMGLWTLMFVTTGFIFIGLAALLIFKKKI